MQRSLYTAVSGLRNHQVKMDVIGNNIANVNTTSFKAGRVRFQDILSQNLRGASAPQGGRGGINPAQVGLGMTVGAIDTIHTQGSLQSTGRITDLAIQGNGFFVVSDGNNISYTRDGAFSLGPDGYLVNAANGFKPLGWAADAFGNISTDGPLQALNIPIGEKVTTRPTQNLIFSANLNALTDEGVDGPHHTTEVLVYDSQGGIHTVEVHFEKTAENEWTWTAYWVIEGEDPDELGGGTLIFDTYGNLDEEASDIPEFTLAPDGVEEITIQSDFSNVTQVVGRSNALVRYQDGFPAGELESFMIGKTGIVSGIYSNGLVVALGQVALASFANPEGLVKAGSNMYQLSANSGQPRIGAAGDDGRGLIETATLEMSNVDLSNEFTEMITTSRAFQANSRVISTSDDLLQEIVNLKR